MAGFPRPGNVKCCAVIHARADERQTDRDVDALIHPQILDRDESLVVILRHHDIEASLPGVHEHGVAGPGSTGLDALRLRLLDRRTEDLLIFGAEETMLARVRV